MKGIHIFMVSYFMGGIAWVSAIIALMIIAIIAQPEIFTHEMCVESILYAISWIASGIACLCTKE